MASVQSPRRTLIHRFRQSMYALPPKTVKTPSVLRRSLLLGRPDSRTKSGHIGPGRTVRWETLGSLLCEGGLARRRPSPALSDHLSINRIWMVGLLWELVPGRSCCLLCEVMISSRRRREWHRPGRILTLPSALVRSKKHGHSARNGSLQWAAQGCCAAPAFWANAGRFCSLAYSCQPHETIGAELFLVRALLVAFRLIQLPRRSA